MVTSILMMALACSMLSVQQTEAAGKKQAYAAYAERIQNPETGLYAVDYNGYQLIQINDDGIPELLCVHKPKDEYDNNGVYDYGLFTYSGGEVVSLGSFSSGVASAGGYRGDTAFIPKKNSLYETYISSGSGEGVDKVYQLKKQKLKEKASGTYSLATETYSWKGAAMSQEAYQEKLNEVFPSEEAKSFEDVSFISKKKMLKKLGGK